MSDRAHNFINFTKLKQKVVQCLRNGEGKQRKIMATEDRLSNLPESILLHILSLLPDKKQVVRTSVLSKPWRFLWKFVPLSLHVSSHGFQNDRDNLDFVASTNRELHYWRSFQKICKFEVEVDFWGAERYAKDIDLWVFFATQVANVEDFALKLYNGRNYEFPKFAYKNTSLRNMVLLFSKLNPSCSVSWSSLVSLSIGYMNLNDAVMEKILSGCPNLECLEMDTVWGFHHFEINSEKLRKLIIKNYVTEGEHVKNWRLLEILAPNIQYFQLLGFCDEIRLSLRNVASLTTAILDYKTFGGQDNLEEMGRNFKEILHSVAHVENLELGSWCLQFLSILELKGWQFPASSWKYVKLNTALEQQDFPGICRLLQNSSGIERMVIDWENHTPRIRFLQELFSRFTNETEDGTRFQEDNCDCSLLQLKTIKIIHFHGPLSENKFVFPLVKYLLKKATVLEKLVVACRFEGSNASQDYVEMEQEILSFPRSSPHASAVFSYQ